MPTSPIPAQMITSGINASGGTGRINSTIGSNQPRNQSDNPIAYPSGIPTSAPKKKPTTTRNNEYPKCSTSMKFLKPAVAISTKRSFTASGAGNQIGSICTPLSGSMFSVPLGVTATRRFETKTSPPGAIGCPSTAIIFAPSLRLISSLASHFKSLFRYAWIATPSFFADCAPSSTESFGGFSPAPNTTTSTVASCVDPSGSSIV